MTAMSQPSEATGIPSIEGGILPTKVIVPLDGSTYSQRAVAPAADLALRFGVDLSVVGTTFESEPAEYEQYLEDQARRSFVRGATATLLTHQFPSAGISSFAADHPGSVIVLSTHGRGTVGQLVLGSVAEELVRLTTSPLVLVGPAHDAAQPTPMDTASFGRIVLCDDGSRGAAALVPTASAWARHLGWDVDLVTVTDASEVPERRSLELADLLRAGGLVVTVTTLNGDGSAAEQIVAHAVDRDANLVAMGTHGRGDHALNALGSTVGGVVRSSPVPVLIRR